MIVARQASPRVQVDEASVTKLGEKLQKDDPTPEIFDEIQRKVHVMATLNMSEGYF